MEKQYQRNVHLTQEEKTLDELERYALIVSHFGDNFGFVSKENGNRAFLADLSLNLSYVLTSIKNYNILGQIPQEIKLKAVDLIGRINDVEDRDDVLMGGQNAS